MYGVLDKSLMIGGLDDRALLKGSAGKCSLALQTETVGWKSTEYSQSACVG